MSLRLFTVCYILEQDSLDKDVKLHLLRFAREADEYQLMYILSYGDTVFLSESEKKSIKERFARVAPLLEGTVDPKQTVEDGLKLIFGAGMATGLAAAAIVATIMTLSHKFYKSRLSKAAKECRRYSGSKKKLCMVKFERDALKTQIEVLEKGRLYCKKGKNPSKCVGNINKNVKKLRSKLGTLKS